MLFGKRREKSAEDAEKPVKAEATNPKGGVISTTATLRDVLTVTHSVPAERIRPLLPEGLPPDLLPAFDGEPVGFLQVVCAYYEDARWSPLPGGMGATSYHQITYRILTRREGQRSAYALKTFVSNSELHFTRRAIEQTVDFGRLSVYVDGNPAKGDYRRYSIRAVGDTGKTELDVKALTEAPAPPVPFRTPDEMTRFLLERDETYFKAAAPRTGISVAPSRLGMLLPVYGELTSARLTPWTDLGLIEPENLTRAFAVHLLASLTVVSSPPRLVRLAGKPTDPATPEAS